MKKNRIIEIAVKMIVAALTAFVTAITTTSCMGHTARLYSNGRFRSRERGESQGTGPLIAAKL